MSVKVMSAVWDNGPTDSTQKFVLLALADNASDDGGNAYPSIPEIARKCSLSERTVIRAIDSLIKSGYLIRRRRKDTSNIYQIVLSRLVSDNLSATKVTDDHPVSDNLSPTGVTDCQQGGDTVSPKPSINRPVNRQPNRGERQNGATAPPPPPDGGAPFRPIPEDVQRAKDKRGEKPSEGTVITQAHPGIRMMHRLTGYFPGQDNEAYIANALGDDPNEAALTRAIELWRASGHKPTNWVGICDWYQELLSNPDWAPSDRFKRNGARPNLKNDPDAREAHNRAVLQEVAHEIETGEWSPW